MSLGSSAYALLGLTIVLGVLAGGMTFAILRLSAAARDTGRHVRGSETALLSAALDEAMSKLKERQRATAARADASERLSDEIIKSLTAGLLVVGLDRQVRVLNRAARRTLHIPESAALADYEDYRKLLGRTALADAIEECLESGTAVIRRPVQLSTPDLGTTHLGVTVSPLFDEESALHGAVCLFSDLTAIKELEEQLRLKESLAAVGELTAGIAHEFRNGLATIHGYSKLIDVKTLPEKTQKYIEAIRQESDVLSQVVTNFLNFATPAKLTLSQVDLRAICSRVAEEMGSDAKDLGGSVTVTGDFAPLEGDEVLLKQAISNLVRNAVEACGDASVPPTVVIRSEIHQTQHVSHIIVEDNGPGVRPEERDRVFRPFVTSKRQGTGLGLALVQKIIVFHNGRISVGRSPLGGASFQIVLPIEA